MTQIVTRLAVLVVECGTDRARLSERASQILASWLCSCDLASVATGPPLQTGPVSRQVACCLGLWLCRQQVQDHPTFLMSTSVPVARERNLTWCSTHYCPFKL